MQERFLQSPDLLVRIPVRRLDILVVISKPTTKWSLWERGRNLKLCVIKGLYILTSNQDYVHILIQICYKLCDHSIKNNAAGRFSSNVAWI